MGEKNRTTDIFSPIKTRRAFEEISSEIKGLVFKGILKPGDRLPSETDLAGQFNVGRQTVREALRLLELSGFIGIQKGGAGGAVVVDTILNTISKSFLDAFQMRRITIDEMTTARLEIEQVVLKTFFEHGDEDDIRALRENVATTMRKVEQQVPVFDDNLHFHRLLARGSKNYVFVIVMESITAVIADFRSLLGLDFPVSLKSVEEHVAMLDAMAAGRNDEALEILKRHLLYVDQRFKHYLIEARGYEGYGDDRANPVSSKK